MTQPKKRAPAKRAASAAGKPQRSRVAPADRRRAAPIDRRRALAAEIVTLERARAELCSSLSHDLRNPLTVVVWSAQLLGRRLPDDDATARRHLDAITRAAEEINQMLYDLSDAARIPDGRLAAALALDAADLSALVEQALAPSLALVQSKALALTVDVAPSLGPVRCDRDRLVRVIGGLLSSAVRRTPHGGAASLRATRDPAGLRIAVEDGGPEIPREDHAALFALPVPPSPGALRRARPVGPAIALFVARGVIEAHGGRLWLEGEPGHGARFVITLPLSP